MTRRFGSPVLQESTQGDAAIAWAAGPDGEPVIRLAKGPLSCDLDIFNTLEIIALRNNGREYLFRGFAGRVTFHLPKQSPVRGETTALAIQNGLPTATIEYVVPRYADEDTAVNPLEGLRVTRTYQVMAQAVEITTSFHNPTSRPMPFPVRLAIQPMPGKRFGKPVRQIASGALKAADVPDAVYLAPGAQSTFLPKLRTAAWTPAPITVFAQDGRLRDALLIAPPRETIGFYSWMSTRGESIRTAELLLPETPLPPRATRSFQYTLTPQ